MGQVLRIQKKNRRSREEIANKKDEIIVRICVQ